MKIIVIDEAEYIDNLPKFEELFPDLIKKDGKIIKE